MQEAEEMSEDANKKEKGPIIDRNRKRGIARETSPP